MALETDIYTAVWDEIYGYRNSNLNYIRGWFEADVGNIPLASLPAISLYPVNVATPSRETGGDIFLLSLILKGIVQHFDPIEVPDGATGRKGILDLYHDLDRAAFTMLLQEEVTVDSVTTTVQTFPIFTDAPAVRDIIIDTAEFTTEMYEDDYPNLAVRIPIDIWYIKTDEVRRILS